ncbi:hypothetical protein SPF06_18635 [Sinomonas sp. JGH33]|uniref:Uncharacterized protein n=1 Tax=Sinomonas terricola TaxID=3110330 RepID=A0ABU5TAS5_9MICC|nr:hypothetical protein [Sinomonas sp. JGH33]MEA5456745.1 hypothetical protein [Sinomonas sp. JGH33]
MTVDPRPVLSVLVMRAVSVTRLEDHFSTAAEALEDRTAGLRASRTPFTREANTVTFTDQAGALVTLIFEEGLDG